MLSAMSAKSVSPRPPLRPIVLSSNRRRPSSSSSPQPHAQQKTNSKGGSSSSSLSLRGSDVLHALQRAATQLPKKKTIKTKKKRPQPPKNQEGEFHDDDDVRPINIRSDWEERIAELEARIQELQQSQYHN